MEDFDSKAALQTMEDLLNTLDKTEASFIEVFGPEIVSAAKAINEINEMRANLKKMRGEVLEFVV